MFKMYGIKSPTLIRRSSNEIQNYIIIIYDFIILFRLCDLDRGEESHYGLMNFALLSFRLNECLTVEHVKIDNRCQRQK